MADENDITEEVIEGVAESIPSIDDLLSLIPLDFPLPLEDICNKIADIIKVALEAIDIFSGAVDAAQAIMALTFPVVIEVMTAIVEWVLSVLP